jgi:hypothetical protein
VIYSRGLSRVSRAKKEVMVSMSSSTELHFDESLTGLANLFVYNGFRCYISICYN